MGLRKEIKAVLDRVTLDPRSALRAIDILVRTKISGTKPIFRLDVSDGDFNKIKVSIDHNAKKIRPDHLIAATSAVQEFAGDLAVSKFEGLSEGFKANGGCKYSDLMERTE